MWTGSGHSTVASHLFHFYFFCCCCYGHPHLGCMPCIMGAKWEADGRMPLLHAVPWSMAIDVVVPVLYAKPSMNYCGNRPNKRNPSPDMTLVVHDLITMQLVAVIVVHVRRLLLLLALLFSTYSGCLPACSTVFLLLYAAWSKAKHSMRAQCLLELQIILQKSTDASRIRVRIIMSSIYGPHVLVVVGG